MLPEPPTYVGHVTRSSRRPLPAQKPAALRLLASRPRQADTNQSKRGEDAGLPARESCARNRVALHVPRGLLLNCARLTVVGAAFSRARVHP
jgi:hypothetical protein